MGGAGLVPLTNAQQAATFTILLINGVLIAILLTLSIVLLPLLLFIGLRILYQGLHGRRNRNRDTQTIESGSVACCAACVNAQNISQGFQSVPGRGFSSNAGAGIFTAPAQSARNSPRVPRNNFSSDPSNQNTRNARSSKPTGTQPPPQEEQNKYSTKALPDTPAHQVQRSFKPQPGSPYNGASGKERQVDSVEIFQGVTAG